MMTDIQAFVDALPRIRVDGVNYTPQDQYTDFKSVFSTPQGKKVFAQILDKLERRIPNSWLATEAELRTYAANMYLAHWLKNTTLAPPP